MCVCVSVCKSMTLVFVCTACPKEFLGDTGVLMSILIKDKSADASCE